MTLRDELAKNHPDMLFADGFDDALLGVSYRAGGMEVAAYDRTECINILERQGMTWEEAEEYFEFNVVAAWVGDQTPVFIAIPEAP